MDGRIRVAGLRRNGYAANISQTLLIARALVDLVEAAALAAPAQTSLPLLSE